VLLGRGLCDELITRPEESYWLWCEVVCDLETSRIRRPWPALGRSATEKKNKDLKFCSIIIQLSTGINFTGTVICTQVSLTSLHLCISSRF